MLTRWLVLVIFVSNVTCFEVPPEWKEAIHSLCSAAEKSVFPHPSPDAQRLYGKSDVGTQV